MTGYDVDELMSIKNAYQGQKFQWIKPLATEKHKLATVVTVTDVVPGRVMKTQSGPVQRFVAILSDQSQVDSEALTNHLMMLHEDQPPLTMAEVQSIYMDPGLDLDAIKADLPSELRELSNLPNSNQADRPTPNPAPQRPDFAPTPQGVDQSSVRQTIPLDTKGLFGLFALEDSNINLKIDVKLPSKALLKMMFENSQDKDQFIDQLSAHINNSITLDDIKGSVRNYMGQDKKKKADDKQQ